jgi:hypothetical protein
MFSAFGVEHGEISKMGPDQSSVHVNKPLGIANKYVQDVNTGNKKVPKKAYPFLHASVVRAYDDSRAHKVKAATKQAGAAAVGGAAGSLAGLTAVALAGKKVPGLRSATQLKNVRALKRIPKVRNMTITSERKIGLASGIGAGAVGGTSGAASNYYALENTKKNKKYKFRSHNG